MDQSQSEVSEDGILMLKCLCSCLNDSEGKTLIRRHICLMRNYMKLRETGIKSIDLPYLTVALEHFSLNLINESQYNKVMCTCLKLAQKPILLHKSSDALLAIHNCDILFSTLGNCLHFSENTGIELMILDVVYFLLTYKEKNAKEVPLKMRIEAVTNSFLPEIIAAYMYFSSSDLYSSILEIMHQLSLQTNFANFFFSLGCLDFWIRNIRITNTLSIREASIKETTSNLLWSVIRGHDSSENLYLPDLKSESLSVLRGWLRREVLFGQSYERNNVAALLLQVFLLIPKLETSRSGILKDIGLLAVATEFGVDNTWAGRVKLKPTNDNLEFKRILLTILLLKSEDPLTKLVLREYQLLNSLSLLLDLNTKCLFKWNRNQHTDLINFCLLALPIISKDFKQEYTQCGATVRILQLIDYFTYKEQNMRMVKKSCLCLHLLVANNISVSHFRTLNVTPVLINVIIHILKHFTLNLLIQMILSYSFSVITSLIQDHKPSKEFYGEEMKKLSSSVLKRFEEPLPTDSKISSSLLMCVCDFVWQSTALNKSTSKHFIDDLGVYSLLNVMEDAQFPVQIMFLGVLADLFIDPRSIPQVATWRGRKGNNSFLSLMCSLWRKQEKLKGVSREDNGCIRDIEFSLMGKHQRSNKIKDFEASPALVDLIGCARPKIAVLVDLFMRRHYDKIQLAKSIYHVPFDAISPEDQITLEIIMCYEELKEGEILSELERAVEKTNITLLPLDTTVIHQLAMRRRGLANTIQKKQKRILRTVQNKEIMEENIIYDKIRDVQFSFELKEAFERDLYLTTTNAHYKKLKHLKYSKFLEEMEIEFYNRENDMNFHKTFTEPRNFLLVKTGRNCHIRSIKRRKKTNNLLPIVDNSPDPSVKLPPWNECS